MKKITSILAITLFVAGSAFAQTGTDKAATPVPSAAEQEMMKQWQAYMTPGDMHAMLAKSNGDWNEDIVMWMAPGAPPTKSTATCTNTMILGGRYQQSINKGMFNGMPFEGISTMGYDNSKKTFQSTWVDNMGTGIMTMEGKYDPATKTMNSTGKQVDPMTGKDMDVRETFVIMDDNNQMMTMYMTPAGGKEYKSMEIKFTRKQ
jgi:hypothetical protein